MIYVFWVCPVAVSETCSNQEILFIPRPVAALTVSMYDTRTSREGWATKLVLS